MDDANRECRFSPAVLAGDALLLLCALVGLAASFLSLYGGPSELPMNPLDWAAAHGDQLFTMTALFALLSLGVWSLPRFRWAAAGGTSALWGLILWGNWRAVSAGALLTVQAVADLFASRVAWGRAFVYDSRLTLQTRQEAVWLFLLLALALLALVLGWAVVRARRWWVVLALTLPPLLPGLLADLYPDWLGFMALAACWCVMLFTDLCRWAAPSGRGRLTLAVFPAVAAVLAAITLFFPREGYTRPAWALKAQEELMNLSSHMADFFSQWDGPFRSTVTYVGAAEEADLARAGPLGYTGRTVLRMKSDYDGRLYLRGSSLAVYEDGVWKALPEGAYEDFTAANGVPEVCPLYLSAMNRRDAPTYTITVNNVGAVGACVYAPYFLLPQDVDQRGLLPVEDAYLARKRGQWEHTVTFSLQEVPPGYEQYFYNTGEVSTAPYSNYVWENYLDVPEELRNALYGLDGLLGDGGFLGGPSQDEPFTSVELARYIASLLEWQCDYDVNAPAAPEGTDPVLYFLNESRRGYCMHYASAATLLLRSMGIPARYVSGFTAVSVPDKEVDVPDRAAHAWVEVWVDGFGWFPVEVTPAAAFDYAGQGLVDDREQPTAEPTDDPMQSDAPQESGDPQPSQTLPGNGEDDPGQGDGPSTPFGWAWAAWLVRSAAVIALLWLAQFALKRLRRRRMSGPEPNRAALACYGCLCRLERWGGRMDERAVELAQKARFSQHTLTGEELALLHRLVDRERTRVWVTSGPVKRLVFRCLWGVPRPLVSLEGDGE